MLNANVDRYKTKVNFTHLVVKNRLVIFAFLVICDSSFGKFNGIKLKCCTVHPSHHLWKQPGRVWTDRLTKRKLL